MAFAMAALFLGRTGVILLLFLITVIIYHPTLKADYVFDDRPALVNNHDVTGPWSRDIFRHDFWGDNISDSTSHKSYRPLTVISFKMDKIIASKLGLELNWFQHGLNVVLHAINSALIFTWLDKKNFGVALVVSALFAAHPVHVDSIAAIVGRADLLYSMMVLVALNLNMGSTEISVRLFAIICLGMIAPFFKEQGIMLLPIVTAQDVIFNHKLKIRKASPKRCKFFIKIKEFRELKTKIFLMGLSTILVLVLRLWIMKFKPPKFQEGDNPTAFIKHSVLLRQINYYHIYTLNIFLMFVPHWLCFDWSMGCIQLIQGLNDIRVLGTVGTWIVLMAAARKSLHGLMFRKKKRLDVLAVAGALLVLPFLPASNLFFVVGFVLAERNLYLSVLGLNIFVVTGCGAILRSKKLPKLFKILIKIGLIGLVTSHGFKCYLRSTEWKTEDRLFRSGLKVCPTNAKIHYNIAKLEADKGNVVLAEKMYRHSLDMWPNYEHALNNLGNLLRKSPGHRGIEATKEAKELFNKALALNPKFAAAWMNLGIVESHLKQYQSAEQSYFNALSLRKSYPDAHFNLGTLYLKTGSKTKALSEFSKAIQQNNNHFSAWSNKIILLDELEQYSDAESSAKQALEIFDRLPDFHFHLANIYGKTQQFEKAETCYKTAISIKPDVSLYHLNLGVLYHRWEKFRLAKTSYEEALRTDPSSISAKNNLESLQKFVD